MSDVTSNELPTRCAPWCEIRTMGIDPDEHTALCESPALAPHTAIDDRGLRYDVYTSVHRPVQHDDRDDFVRLTMDAAGGHEGFTLQLHRAHARALAAALIVAADVADGLRDFPGGASSLGGTR